MKNTKTEAFAAVAPRLSEKKAELQKFGTTVPLPIGLSAEVCGESARALNQILADTSSLRDMYKKHHWQVSGPTFYPLHLLFDKHYGEQVELVDLLAERIQTLGGVSVAMAADVAEMTRIERPPKGRESVPVQISRLLEAHEMVLRECHDAASRVQKSGDDGTNDILVSDLIRTNELQVWFLSQHLVPTELIDDERYGSKERSTGHNGG
jgi:starvation-inducible DNA-binding protein